MSLTHNITRGWSSGSDSISGRVTVTAGAEQAIDELIPAGTDVPVAFTLDVSQLKSLYIICSTPATIETNNAAGTNVFNLQANLPYSWVFGDPPIRDTAGTAVTVDITSLFVTAVDATQLKIRALFDPTV